MLWIILAVVAVVLLIFLIKLFKVPKAPCILFVSGEVKGGKTMLSLYFAIRKYRVVHRQWKIKCFISELLGRTPPEEPVLCSNIPVAGIPYVPLTRRILQRKDRFPYKSVTFISESHLVIDSLTIKNAILNEEATLFYKLYGHTTRGGFAFVESQTISDNHFSLKRSISRYYQIFNNVKIKPFFALLQVHELAYSEDNSVVNMNAMDYDRRSQWVFVPWSIVKQYDCYCYSAFTDDCPVIRETVFKPIVKQKDKNLKCYDLVSFRKFRSLEIEKYEDDEC